MLILPDKSISIWKTFWDENKILVYKYIVKQVKAAIEKGDQKAILFGFEANNMTVWVERDRFVESLDKALQTFIREEYYEYAAKTQKIIDQFLIDEVIKDSQQK